MLELSKFNVSKDFEITEIVSYNLKDDEAVLNTEWLELWNMKYNNMMIRSRPTYPTDRVTYNFANLTRNKKLRHISFYLRVNHTYAFHLMLEDSLRKFWTSKHLNIFDVNICS